MKSWTFGLALVMCLTGAGCGNKKDDTQGPGPGSGKNPTSAAGTQTPASGKDFPSPSSWEIRPYVVGQWIRVSLTSGNEPPADHLFKIVGQEGNAFWLEVEAKTPAGTNVTQLLLDDSIRKGYKSGIIKKARLKPPGGQVQELSGATLALAAGVVDQYLGVLDQAQLSKAQRADATVPAGNFRGCYVLESDKPVMGIPVKSKSWYHPQVPVMGLVRSESVVNGKPSKMELLEIHESGAKSAI